MNTRTYVLLLLSLLWLYPLNAQSSKKFTISGYVQDARTGEKLIGARVYDEKSQKGTLTNNFGFFSLTLPTGEVQLVASYTGFQRVERALQLTADLVLNLDVAEFALNEVEIVAEDAERIEDKTEMSVVDIPIRQIKLLPALMGEVDVIKAVQLMPGVQSGSEGSSGLYVRGGGPDQNLILLDDVPLYYVSHLGGFFSVFNADAIKSVKLTKGGFPARYGGRLSSVLDIRMKEGDMNKFHGEGSIGLISSKLSLQGPIIKGKSSFIISARRTYADLFTRPISRLATQGRSSFGYHFYDLNGKVNHTFSDKDRLYFSFYMGDDKLKLTSSNKEGVEGQDGFTEYRLKNTTAWGNRMGALRWNHIWGPKLFSNLTATYTRYGFRADNDIYDAFTYQGDTSLVTQTSEGSLNYGSGIEDWGAKLDFDWYPAPSHAVKFGLASTYHTFTPGLLGIKYGTNNENTVDTTLNQQTETAFESAIYIEDEFKVGNRFSANMGLHGVHYWVNDKSYWSLQPRASARLKLTNRIAWKASYVQMRQFIHLLSNSGAGLPIDLWVPATDRVPPQESWQVATGFATSFLDGQLSLSVEGYYKEMKGLIEYKEGTDFFLSMDQGSWEDRVETGGKGTAYGVEFFLQKKRGKTTGWIGYTLSWNNRQFENLNNGEVFPYRFDRRHDLSVVVSHQLTDRISLSGTWVYGTGNAITLPSGGYGTTIDPNNGTPNQNYGSFAQVFNGAGFFGTGVQLFEDGRNGFRMQAYHRLDLGVNFTKETKWGERTWNISVYNAYNRLNPYTYIFRQRYNPRTGQTEDPSLTKISLFPIIPSVSYSFKF